MKTKFARFSVLVAATMAFVLVAGGVEKERSPKESTLPRIAGTPVNTYLNINNISTVFWNNGYSDIDIQDNNSGFVFPKGSGKTAVFKSGFLWGGIIGGEVRVGGSAYRTGLQGGRILSPGVAEDPNLAKNRIYRVRPDYRTGDLSAEVRDEGKSSSEIRAQYERDWNEWPVADGAPYDDVNANGTYEPSVDVPGVKGADQTIYFVCNDLNSGNTTNLYGSNPMGIEMHVTVWAYSQQGALGNMLFRKYLLVNRGTSNIDSMYVTQWTDTDLGDSNDDFSGCDTTLSVGYTYNAFESDATYNPLPPPTVGFDFFQGPVVAGAPTDTAIFLGKKVGGKKNLPMTAHYYFARGDANVTDPTQGSYEGTTQFYNFMKGRVGRTGVIFTDPNNRQTTFALDGDPVAGTGWIDGQILPSGDRRNGLASGPFTMAIGDTQEIVVAEIAAGAIPGVNRLNSINLMKFFDNAAQLAYDNFFVVPSAPPAPKLTITEADKQVIFVWGSDPVAVAATENSNNAGFEFQGYNIYQLPSASATIDQAKRIATFDKVDGVQIIQDRFFDAAAGVLTTRVAQFGTDAGIKRNMTIKTDALRGNTPLINGIRYYFAVTAYSYNPDPNAVPNNLENPLQIITVVPHSPNPGIRFQGSAGDTIRVQHTSSVTGVNPSEGVAAPLIVDPSRLTGQTYEVTFEPDTATGGLFWKLTNKTTNTVMLSQQTNQSGDADYLITDGFQVVVSGPPEGMKDWEIPNGTRRWTFADADGFHFEGFFGAIGYDAPNHVFFGTPKRVRPDQVRNTLVKFATASSSTSVNTLTGVPYGGWNRETTTDPNMSYAYRYMRGATAPPQQPEFAPFIVNPSGGYAYQDYKKGIPWSAWNVEVDPPQRLAVGFLENNQPRGSVDGLSWPPPNGVGVTNTEANGPREWFFIFNTPYTDATPDPALQIDILNNDLPCMWFGTVGRRGGANYFTGDEFLILANHPNTAADVFTFTAPSVVSDPNLAKQDVNAINVFPNPYYGVNSEEINKYQRFVTFNHLPDNATIRIFNLAGVLVRTITHAPASGVGSQFERWDLSNESGLPVGSGLYIAHIDMPQLGVTKILKLAIVHEQQILDRF